MSGYQTVSNALYEEDLAAAETWEEDLLDDDFYEALVDALNQNFVMEVEASRRSERSA
jgi:hypothetical protein